MRYGGTPDGAYGGIGTVVAITGGTATGLTAFSMASGVAAFAAGTSSAPSVIFAGDTTAGWYRPSANGWAITSSGAPQVAFFPAANLTRFASSQTVAFSSGVDAATDAADTNFSRISAGLIGIGTGAAASFAGALKLTTLQMAGKTSLYNGITTAGIGTPVVVAAGRVTAQSAANVSISTFTVGAADGSFEISANMNVTASTTLVTTLTCTYTDEASAARTMILPVASLAGSFIAAGAITGAGASVWETPVMHIRCKTATAITILTSAGTFTGVTYTAEGIIKQTA